MNENGYKIMHVGDGTDSIYGDIYIVKANPVQNNGFGLYHSMSICNETESFFFPANQSLINQVLLIARGGGIWYPNENDFSDEQIFDEEKQKHIIVHRHISFHDEDYDNDLNSGHDICLIPNIAYKIRTLNQQYYTGNWFELYYSFRSYVESLAEGDDVRNFWGWLFERSDFEGYMPWDLPSKYEAEYNRFLNACEKIDGTEY